VSAIPTRKTAHKDFIIKRVVVLKKQFACFAAPGDQAKSSSALGRNVMISSSGLRVSEMTHNPEYKGGTVCEIHPSYSATKQMTCFLTS
jgi:hypothetical protein